MANTTLAKNQIGHVLKSGLKIRFGDFKPGHIKKAKAASRNSEDGQSLTPILIICIGLYVGEDAKHISSVGEFEEMDGFDYLETLELFQKPLAVSEEGRLPHGGTYSMQPFLGKHVRQALAIAGDDHQDMDFACMASCGITIEGKLQTYEELKFLSGYDQLFLINKFQEPKKKGDMGNGSSPQE